MANAIVRPQHTLLLTEPGDYQDTPSCNILSFIQSVRLLKGWNGGECTTDDWQLWYKDWPKPPIVICSFIHYCCFILFGRGIDYLTTDLVYIIFVEYNLKFLHATVMFFLLLMYKHTYFYIKFCLPYSNTSSVTINKNCFHNHYLVISYSIKMYLTKIAYFS